MPEQDTQQGQRISLLAPPGEAPAAPDISRRTTRRLLVMMVLLHLVASLFLIRSIDEDTLTFPYDYSHLVNHHWEVLRGGPLLYADQPFYRVIFSWPPFDSLRVTGFSYEGYRLVPLLTHVMLALLCYVITTAMSNRRNGLVAAFLVLTSPVLSQQSRQGLHFIEFPFNTLVTLACFAIWIHRPTVIRAIPVIVTGLFLYSVHWLSIPFAVLAVVLTCAPTLIRKHRIIPLVCLVVSMELLSWMGHGYWAGLVFSYVPMVILFGAFDFFGNPHYYVGQLLSSLSIASTRVGYVSLFIAITGMVLFILKIRKLESRWYFLAILLLVCPLLWYGDPKRIAFFIIVASTPVVAIGLMSLDNRRFTRGITIFLIVAGFCLYMNRLSRDYFSALIYPLTTNEYAPWSAKQTATRNPEAIPSAWPMKECLEEMLLWLPHKVFPKADGSYRKLWCNVVPAGFPMEPELTYFDRLGYQLRILGSESWIEIAKPIYGQRGRSDYNAVITVESTAGAWPLDNLRPGDSGTIDFRFIRAKAWPVSFIYPATMTLWINSEYSSQRSESDIPIPAAFFDEKIRLVRTDITNYTLAPGGVIDATMYWEILRPVEPGTSAYLHVLLPEDKIIPFHIDFHPQPTEKFYTTTAKLTLPEDMKPGEYTMGVGLYVGEREYKYWREDLLDCYYRLKKPLQVTSQ